ncbi:transglutaminase family protein [Ferruginibacter sp. SUN106]|uniref:transglutaminase family protein n=1 Tax=Ferruginibacter sp. SUN106 TaxID=2978348 RepID=UPI003D368914
MLYSVTHTTTYLYHEQVSLCHNIAMLSPRDTATQVCRSSNIIISPLPEVLDKHTDFFGNKAVYFVVEQEHDTLSVTVNSVIEKIPLPVNAPVNTISWEAVRDMLQTSTGQYINEKQFIAVTDMTAPTTAISNYAAESFTPGQSLFKAVYHLMQRIYTEFKFTPGFTTISTPLSTVMKERKGVCQDFAHLGISCLHAMGLPAKYISGYIETLAPEGKEKLTGVDASHAWFSVFIPEMGWVDFDPTNNKIPDEQYITVGWGRDYFDIVPLKGVIMSSSPHEMRVSVDVKRM